MTNGQILERIDAALKAITVADMGSSILTTQKADRFIRTVEEATPVLQGARRLNMAAPTRDIDRIAFAERVLQAPADAEVDTDGSKPTPATNQLSVVELMGIVGLKDDTLEDNIEKEDFENTLLDLTGGQVGRDLEELFLNGDTASGDNYLARLDGWLKTAANSVDGAGSVDFDNTDPEAMFQAMLDALPKKFLRDRSRWVYLVSWDAEDDYRDIVRARGSDLGDSAQTGSNPIPYKGIPIREVPNLPAGSAMLTMLDNLVYGLYREVRIERDRIPKQRQTDFVITTRADCDFEDENAAVVATGYVGS